MNETEALLVVERGPVSSLRFALQQDQVTIGRSAGNELVLADAEVSRRHARVVRRADGYAVEDIGSTNGTFVNGQRISHLTLLQDGDTIDLGDTVRLRFVSSPGAPPAPPEPSVAISERPTEMLAPPPGTAGYDAQPRPAAVPAYTPPAPVMPAPAPAAAPPYSPPPAAPAAYPPPLYNEPPRRGRALLIGCGLLVAFLLVCAGTFLILDAYDQGQLLYCGPAQSLFETILGSLGLASPCP
jgi:hypothetical protein